MPEFPVNQTQTYQTKSVFVSSGAFDSEQTISGSLRQLSRIQSVDWGVNYPVEQVTYLDSAEEAYMSSHNAVDVDLTWLHTNGRNEQALGLVDTVGLSGALAFNLDQEKNLYVTIENTPGIDAIGATGAGQIKTVIGMGNALMTSYTLNGAVGGLIQSRATLNCLTAFVYTGSSGNAVPGVHYQDGTQLTGRFTLFPAFSQYDPNVTGYANPIAAPAVGARDMYLVFPQGTPFGITFSGAQACYLQNFDLALTIERRELKPLGSVYPPVRAVHYPMHIDLTTNAIVNRYQRDQLDRIDCLGSGQSVYLIVKQPCSSDVLFGVYLDKLQIESQSFTSSIGATDTATTKWRGLVTSPTAMFFNPWVSSLVNLDTQSGWGGTW